MNGCTVLHVDDETELLEQAKIFLEKEDGGEGLSEDIKKLFSGEAYIGGTTGAGGVRYYIIRKIAEHNNADIEVKDSKLGGARFEVYLKKAES